MQSVLVNKWLPIWILIVATACSLNVVGCSRPKFDLLAEVNKRFPVQPEKVAVQTVTIKCASLATGAATIAAGETAVVSKGEKITILAEVSEGEWGLFNAGRIWDESIPHFEIPKQFSSPESTEPKRSNPVMNFAVFLRGTDEAKILLSEKLQIAYFQIAPPTASQTKLQGTIKATLTAPKSPGVYVLDLFIVNGSATKEDAPRMGFIPIHRVRMEVR